MTTTKILWSEIEDDEPLQHMTDNITLTDTDFENNLRLYHYTHCDENSEDDIKRSKGIIRCGDKIVRKTFDYTPTFLDSDIDAIASFLGTKLSNCKFYSLEEGCLITLFYHNDRWHVSTSKKINAFNSFWPNTEVLSFGENFIRALKSFNYNSLDEYTSLLDTKKRYTYLLRNTAQNRLVCLEPPVPTVYFTGAFNETHLLVEGNDSYIPYPIEYTFNSINEIIDCVKNVDWTTSMGVIVYLPNQTQCKIVNNTYNTLQLNKNGMASILYAYFNNNIFDYYQEYYNDFENSIDKLMNKLVKSYIYMYIKHQKKIVPQDEFEILLECHQWHKKNRNINKVNETKIKQIFNLKSPVFKFNLLVSNL